MTVLFHKGQQGFDGFQGQAYRMAVAEKDLSALLDRGLHRALKLFEKNLNAA